MLYQKLLTGKDPYIIVAGKGAPYVRHRHHEIEMSFCKKGSYSILADGKIHTLKAGTLAIINTMTIHEYLPDATSDSIRLTVELGPEMLGDYFEAFTGKCDEIVLYDMEKLKTLGNLFALLSEITETTLAHPPFEEIILKGHAYTLAANLLKHFSADGALRIPEGKLRDIRSIERALDIIYNRYHEPLTIEEVSRACGYGKSNFCKTFKQNTGETFHSLLNRHRIEVACMHLKENALSIEEIAYGVGFSDVKSFCRVFKSVMGKSAGQYKKGL